MTRKIITCFSSLSLVLLLLLGSCDRSTDPLLSEQYQNRQVSIDRFSDKAGTLFQRRSNPDLPAPNEPINFDKPPFLTKGLGPEGEVVEFYNFDVMLRQPAPIYVLYREGENTPVKNQQNIVNVIPGDEGYNDFWQVYKVIVPFDYDPNSITSAAEIWDRGYEIKETTKVVNCPIVPYGSTAHRRFTKGENPNLIRGWYKDKIIYYFTFEAKKLSLTQHDQVPVSSLYVTFNTNPDQHSGGHISGFKTEEGSNLTHNVASAAPTDDGYSPLWLTNVYDNSDFDAVSDLSSAQTATILKENTALVNRPIVNKMQQ